MNIKKNQKGFVLPVILVVVVLISTAGGYIGIKNNFQSQNKKQEKLIVEKDTSIKEETKETQNQEQEKTVKKEIRNDNQTTSEKEKNQTQENEKKQNISAKEDNEETVINNKEKNEEKKPVENKKTNYIDQFHLSGFIYIDNELQLSASKEQNGIRLTWTRCNSDKFVAYKIARSESASDVYYPRDGSIASISNQNSLSYFDNNVEKEKTYYYRVCSLEKNGESWCGNVISISF